MRHLQRLPEPDVLRQRGPTWRERLETSDKARPDSRQYGHEEIRQTLRTMSHHKCFYCETKVAGGKNEEVDHYVEVAEDRSSAFAWNNLYLSCHMCNSKKRPNRQIPVLECIDPCGPDDPGEHLTFEDEVITAKQNSVRGLKTIQKYDLNRGDLQQARTKALQEFERTLRRLHERRGARPLNDRENEIIRRFAQPDHPFSLMFEVYLESVDLA
jgi:uncharacterized protein (TIGR02646 family)